MRYPINNPKIFIRIYQIVAATYKNVGHHFRLHQVRAAIDQYLSTLHRSSYVQKYAILHDLHIILNYDYYELIKLT